MLLGLFVKGIQLTRGSRESMALQLLLLLLECLEGHVPRVDVHVAVGGQHGGQGRGGQGAWLHPIHSCFMGRLQHTASNEPLSSLPEPARALATSLVGQTGAVH